MMQNFEHDHTGKYLVRKRQPMGVGHDIDPGKRQDVGRYDLGPEILDVGGSAADIENAARGTTFEQAAVKIPVEQAQRLLLFPPAAVNELALVQIGRAAGHGIKWL